MWVLSSASDPPDSRVIYGLVWAKVGVNGELSPPDQFDPSHWGQYIMLLGFAAGSTPARSTLYWLRDNWNIANLGTADPKQVAPGKLMLCVVTQLASSINWLVPGE